MLPRKSSRLSHCHSPIAAIQIPLSALSDPRYSGISGDTSLARAIDDACADVGGAATFSQRIRLASVEAFTDSSESEDEDEEETPPPQVARPLVSKSGIITEKAPPPKPQRVMCVCVCVLWGCVRAHTRTIVCLLALVLPSIIKVNGIIEEVLY